ncbi:hypothetical protein [Spirillospora albida]|uniref:hypothetical protein n=1 Tax=Spirillospora albida TaxID=58123 RepID=UPI000690CDB3|nr:hypothetical protein [Spirillospora albida]
MVEDLRQRPRVVRPSGGEEAGGGIGDVLARGVTAGFVKVFTTLARVRGGRPLHPQGVVLDATLRLSGRSRGWGVPFLDDAAELRGVARMSRSVGLPTSVPDLLGLALRWRAPGGEESELLLATTGSGALGRFTLRPVMRWSPQFYGSLLPYRAGDRLVMLGAIARGDREIPADFAALEGAIGEGPMVLDLVVADGKGAWERFGELVLSGPARSDESEPRRFNPIRRPILGLVPAGLFQQLRGPTYEAVQQVDRGGSSGK